VNDSEVGRRVREQVGRFSGIFSPRFSKPQAQFVEQMIFGIQAAQDVKLSNIGRALGESIALKKTEERLSHHLAAKGMGQAVNETVAQEAAVHVRKDTLIVIDPTDIRKTYAEKMPYLATVRDGSTGELVPGYWSCVAMACEPQRRRVIPLHLRLWSAEAPDFVSENHQLLEVIDTVRATTGRRGIYVIDRGGDRIKLFNPFLDRKIRFIARLVGDRDLIFRGQPRQAADLARGCSMRYAETLVHEEGGRERVYHLEYGCRQVRLPGREEHLTLVIVRGFGEEPLMLLTNVEVKPSRTSLWFIVQGYLARWMVEETIRFIKQSYHLEDIRVLDYDRLKNLVALTLAATYFAAVWLGEKLRLAVLCRRVAKLAKRFFGVPEFHYYALADGIRTLLSRLGRWIPRQDDLAQVPSSPQQMILIG
jgi:hypothetical protein